MGHSQLHNLRCKIDRKTVSPTRIGGDTAVVKRIQLSEGHAP